MREPEYDSFRHGEKLRIESKCTAEGSAMSGYGSIYGGYYGGRGPVRHNEARTRPSWNTNYAESPGFPYNGAYGLYGGAYSGYGFPYGGGYSEYGPPPYGGGYSGYGPPPYGGGYSGYVQQGYAPSMMYRPNYDAGGPPHAAQMQQPGASTAQSVPLYSTEPTGSLSNNPPTTTGGGCASRYVSSIDQRGGL